MHNLRCSPEPIIEMTIGMAGSTSEMNLDIIGKHCTKLETFTGTDYCYDSCNGKGMWHLHDLAGESPAHCVARLAKSLCARFDIEIKLRRDSDHKRRAWHQ